LISKEINPQVGFFSSKRPNQFTGAFGTTGQVLP